MIDDMTIRAFGELNYEQRIVIFFDVLGWKDRIERAGNNPHRIAELRLIAAVMAFGDRGEFSDQGGVLTSFSDNVVVSLPFRPEQVPEILEGIAKVQFGMATLGFFIRGGITVGDLHHDNRTVFGPALVRAYDLEHHWAVTPRIILDPNVPALSGLPAPVARDNEFDILDPFTVEFMDHARFSLNPEDFRSFLLANGGAPGAFTDASVQSPQVYLFAILQHLAEELRCPLKPTVRTKLEWLHDRIAARVGISFRGAQFRPDESATK